MTCCSSKKHNYSGKLNINQWIIRMRPRSDKPCQTDMHTLLLLHALSWPFAYGILETNLTRKFVLSNELLISGQGQINHDTDMYIIKYFHTPNIIDPFVYSIRKTDHNTKNNLNHWNINMRWRSDDTCQLDNVHLTITVYTKYSSYCIQYDFFGGHNTKTELEPLNHEIRSISDDTCQFDMYTLQSFYTPNIVDLLLIVYGLAIKTYPC